MWSALVLVFGAEDSLVKETEEVPPLKELIFTCRKIGNK